jgi:hypothetical protein
MFWPALLLYLYTPMDSSKTSYNVEVGTAIPPSPVYSYAGANRQRQNIALSDPDDQVASWSSSTLCSSTPDGEKGMGDNAKINPYYQTSSQFTSSGEYSSSHVNMEAIHAPQSDQRILPAPSTQVYAMTEVDMDVGANNYRMYPASIAPKRTAFTGEREEDTVARGRCPSLQSLDKEASAIPKAIPEIIYRSITKEDMEDSKNRDKHFKKWLYPGKFFRPGRVFALLWPRPLGKNDTDLTLPLGWEKPEERIRRFIVVRGKNPYCWCLPIKTYDGAATTKIGVCPEDHAIVYMSDTTPMRLSEETGLLAPPIEVIPSAPNQKLDMKSRLNFAKVYIIAHNVSAMGIGIVSSSSQHFLEETFEKYVNERRNANRSSGYGKTDEPGALSLSTPAETDILKQYANERRNTDRSSGYGKTAPTDKPGALSLSTPAETGIGIGISSGIYAVGVLTGSALAWNAARGSARPRH